MVGFRRGNDIMKVWRRHLVLLCVVVWICPFLRADEPTKPADPKHPGYEYRENHDPNGIGKFYMGGEIAQVMGHQAAYWLSLPKPPMGGQATKCIENISTR